MLETKSTASSTLASDYCPMHTTTESLYQSSYPLPNNMYVMQFNRARYLSAGATSIVPYYWSTTVAAAASMGCNCDLWHFVWNECACVLMCLVFYCTQLVIIVFCQSNSKALSTLLLLQCRLTDFALSPCS